MWTLTLAIVSLFVAPPEGYARPTLLIEPEALAKFDPGSVRILDARTAEKYATGHVPEAVLVPVGAWSKAVTDGKADAAFWKPALASVGVSPTKPVVVVAEDIRDAARLWWLLSYAGVADVRLLNGGSEAYLAAKLPVSTTATTATAEPHDWTPTPRRQATKADVLTMLKNGAKGTIVDARAADEFAGEKKLAEKAGHVPGATNLDWVDLIDPATKKFKPAGDLAKLFADRNIDLSGRCVTYCQSGGRASVVAFGMMLMGGKDVQNYYRSWSEWGNATDTPIEKK